MRTWLDEAVIGIAGKNTAIGDAIGLAVKRLRQRPANSRILVLITDGANTAGAIEPLTATRLAAEQGVKIYTIGIGAGANDSLLWAIATGTDPRDPDNPDDDDFYFTPPNQGRGYSISFRRWKISDPRRK